MLERNQELHSKTSSDAAKAAEQNLNDTSVQESKSEGRDQETQAEVTRKPDTNSAARGGLQNNVYIDPKYRLNIQVKFCPSCQVNVAGRGLESLEFFPFKLPPLDRRKTDIRELQNAVTRYLVVGRLSGQCLVACLIQ